MLNITLRQLEYFVTVAAVGSVARAAEELSVSRSTLAAALEDMEHALKAELFRRRKAHGTDLTPTGQALLDQAISLLNAATDFEAASSTAPVHGSLTVGCFPSLAPTVLPTILETFALRYPRVDLNFESASQDVLLDRLRKGQVEVAVMYAVEEDHTLESATLYTSRFHVVLGKENPLAEQDVVDLQDLADEPLILLDTPPSTQDILGYFRSNNVRPQVRHRTGHFELVRSLVARGIGYSLFHQQPRNQFSYEGLPLVARPLRPEPPLKSAAVVWPKERRLSARAAVFLAVCREHADVLSPPSLYPPSSVARGGRPDPGGPANA